MDLGALLDHSTMYYEWQFSAVLHDHDKHYDLDIVVLRDIEICADSPTFAQFYHF